jgi:hypothetical protein
MRLGSDALVVNMTTLLKILKKQVVANVNALLSSILKLGKKTPFN